MKPALAALAVALAAAGMAAFALAREARRAEELERRIAALEAAPPAAAAKPAESAGPKATPEATPPAAKDPSPPDPKAASDDRQKKLEARLAQLEERLRELSRANRASIADELAGLSADEVWEKAQLAFQDGLSERANALLREFLRLFPNDARVPDALMSLGKVEMKMSDLAAAAALYDRVLAEFPDSKQAPYAHFFLGMTRLESGDAAAGRAHYEKAIEGLGDNPYWQAAAMFNLGEAYAKDGQPEVARDYLRRITTQFAGNQAAAPLVKQATVRLKEMDAK